MSTLMSNAIKILEAELDRFNQSPSQTTMLRNAEQAKGLHAAIVILRSLKRYS